MSKFRHPSNKLTNIEKLKSKYPTIAKEYEMLSQEQYELFAGKMLDYGKGNISVGSNLETEEETHVAMTGLWFRINDKIQRFITFGPFVASNFFEKWSMLPSIAASAPSMVSLRVTSCHCLPSVSETSVW